MGFGTILGIAWRLLSGVSSAAVGDTASRLVERLAALQDAKSDVERAEIEREIAQLKMIHDLQQPQAARWWSPMQLGQYLVVVSFGLWFALICTVSWAKPMLLEGRWEVDDLPPHIFEMAWWLFPLVIIGAKLGGRK